MGDEPGGKGGRGGAGGNGEQARWGRGGAQAAPSDELLVGEQRVVARSGRGAPADRVADGGARRSERKGRAIDERVGRIGGRGGRGTRVRRAECWGRQDGRRGCVSAMPRGEGGWGGLAGPSPRSSAVPMARLQRRGSARVRAGLRP